MINIGVDLVSSVSEFFGLGGSKKPDLPPSSSGPKLMHLEGGWIPQGQAHDAANGELLTTFNQDDQVLVSVQDADSGSDELTNVILGSPPPPDHLHGWERAAFAQSTSSSPSKGGGIAINDDIVYVADTQGVYRYSLDDIRNAEPGETVAALGFQPTKTESEDGHNASFITVHDGHAYVGQFSVSENGIGQDTKYPKEGALTRYEIAEDGTFVNPAGPIEIPAYAQGVAVTEQGLFYTTSYGSKTGSADDASPHALVYQPFEDFESFTVPPGSAESPVEVLTLDYYAEEFNIVDGEVWVTYESNATKYTGNYESNVGEMPGNESIQRISIDELDLSRTNITRHQLESAFAGG